MTTTATATATWTVKYDAEGETWDIIRDGEYQQGGYETRAEAHEDMVQMRDEEIADDLRNEICDLVTDLGADDLVKLRKILETLKG